MGLSSRNRKIAPACAEQAGAIRGAKMTKEVTRPERAQSNKVQSMPKASNVSLH